MPYFHVIARLGADAADRVLFKDLSAEELDRRFVRPYERSETFFCGADLVTPSDLRSVQVIRTAEADEVERMNINRKDRESIDRLNAEPSGVVFLSLGRGYHPDDIGEAGDDVTSAVLKGPPGFRAGRSQRWKAAVTWLVGIAAAVAAAGVIKWLGWT